MIACISMQVCKVVEGLYQLEVTIFGYNNPTGRCQECGSHQECCDAPADTRCSGRALCDSSFTYCLRGIGSTGRNCSYFGNRTSNSNSDDGPINFSQSRVLGLENPVILEGLTNAYMVMSLIVTGNPCTYP